jgi:hypothetical protein
MSIGVSMNWRNSEGRTSGLSYSRDTLAEALCELLTSLHYYQTECGYREFQIQVYAHCDKCSGTGGQTVGKRVRRWKDCKHCRNGIAELLAEFVYTTPHLTAAAV